jgi:hypothetical protein
MSNFRGLQKYVGLQGIYLDNLKVSTTSLKMLHFASSLAIGFWGVETKESPWLAKITFREFLEGFPDTWETRK